MILLRYSVASDTKLDEMMNGSSTSLPEAVKPVYDTDVVEKVGGLCFSDKLTVAGYTECLRLH